MTGKSVMIPGLTMVNIATNSVYDDEMVRNIMERHYLLMKEFRMLDIYFNFHPYTWQCTHIMQCMDIMGTTDGQY